MDLLYRDNIIKQLSDDINHKNASLKERYKYLKNNDENNELIYSVLQKYKEHFNDIIHNNNNLLIYLTTLLQYLEQITENKNNITKSEINKSNIARNIIITQIKITKEELNELEALVN